MFSAALCAAMLGCSHKKTQIAQMPPAPSIYTESGPSRTQMRNVPANDTRGGKVLYVETGTASWYGPPYNKHKAATGEIFDMNQPTAAHRTLPLNSIVRVTNLKTGKSIVLRINDRGPFVGDRILDLSMAAAKAIDVYRSGLAKVRIELLSTPAPLDYGGRWGVQIGAFTDHDEAAKLKSRLARKYQSAKVIEFAGPTGEWVRIRPPQDDRERAFEMARETKSSEGGVFLVRLD